MTKDTLPARKGKEDEPSYSNKKPKGGKNESSGSGETSGLRRSGRETPSRKNNSSKSPISVRKSQRLGNRSPPKTPSAKKKIEMQSPMRKSEREKKIQSRNLRTPEKGLTSKGGLKLKGHNTPDSKDKKEAKGNGNSEKGKQSPEIGTKRKKTRLDARHYRDMFKPLKKKAKVSDSAEKTKQENHSDSGNSGSENDVEGQQEHSDEEELKGECTKSVDGNEGGPDSDVEKHVDVEKPSSSLGIDAKRNKTEHKEEDYTMMESNKKIHNQEECLATNEMSSGGNGLRCNTKGTTPGSPSAESEGTHTCPEDVVPSISSVSKLISLTDQCDKCSRKRRLDHNSPKQELCCCLSNLMNDVDAILVTKDRGECGTVQFAEKNAQEIQQSDPSLDVERSTCATCKRPGKLLHCGGKGCKRSYHASCLLTPKVDILLREWYCSQCIRKRLTLGVHSVSEGIESIWDVRELQLSNSEGVERQKQYFVKYKGLAHIHNHWVPEMQLLYEAPELIAKFNEKKEGQWKPEWAVPHRLLLKRSLRVDYHAAKHSDEDKHNDEDAGAVPNDQCEWLVKWCGLDHDQATWEFEDPSWFKTPDVQRLIREYETRHDKARREPLSRGNEIKERRKGLHVKLGRLSGGGLSGADSCYLNSVNKLREYHHKGHNAVLLDEQDRALKVIYLVSSLVTNVHRPFVIITPHASLSFWEAEFLRTDSSVNVVVYYGSTDARKVIRRLELYEEGGGMMLQVLLSSVEVISEDLEELKGIEWEAVIVDDCQQSCIWAHSVAIKNLATDWRVLLVNAQLKDNVAEYINILSMLEPGGNSNQNPGPTVDSSEKINIFKKRLSSFIVYAKFVEFWVPVQISNLQLEQYCSLLLSNSTALRSFSKSDPVGLLRDILISTRKCCDHPYIVDPSLQSSLASGHPSDALLDLGIRASGKLLFLDKILSELRNQELKVLILFQSIGGSGRDTTGDILDDFLHYRFGLDSYEHVDGGGCLSSKKQAALNKFNRERERSFFLLETRACLPSIKLSSVDAVIIFGSDWNPVNDLRALQRITIDSKLEQIKVFRLYCPCTVEEKVLVLAKNDMILDSTLQGISPSTSHMLLMWGSSYLFTKLDEFHHENVADYRDNIVPEYSFLKDVCEEFLSLFQNNQNMNSNNFISVARQTGGGYLKNTGLIGEQKIQVEDGVPPHGFWTKLLEGKQPQWKYLSGSSHRNRKRVHYLDDSPIPSEVQADEVAKKRKRMDNTKVDSSNQQVGGNQENLNAANKDSQENAGTEMVNNIESMANINPASQKSNGPTSQTVAGGIPAASFVTTESDNRINSINDQRELFQMLKPTIQSLCEILLLKDDGKILAEQFLEYIVNNHRVTREPETILQAFEISVCWTVAALLNQKIDHKKSLAIASEKMNFSCREDEADFLYSKLKLLKKMFLLRSEALKIPNSSNDPSTTNGIRREFKENGVEPEKSSLHIGGFEQVLKPVQTTNNGDDMLRHIKKVKKKCDKLMERLKIKQNEELEEFKKTWEENRAELEKKYRMESAVIRSIHNKSSIGVDKLKILDDNYAKKRKELENQISISLKELETRQQAERDEQQKKAARWLEQVKSFAQEELLDKSTSENEQLPSAEHIEPCKHSNETADTTDKLLQRNSDSETSRTLGPEKQTVICQDDATINSSVSLPVPKEIGSGNVVVEGSQEQPFVTPTREVEKDTSQINSVEIDRLTTLEPNRVNGTSTSLFSMSTEPLFSPGIPLTEQQTVDPASMGPLSVSQGLRDEPCQRVADGAEQWVQHISEPVPSNISHNGAGGLPGYSIPVSVVTPSHGYHQTRDALSSGLDNECGEVQAGSQTVLELAVDHAVDANLGQRETPTSTRRDAFAANSSNPNPLQGPTFTISRLPSLSSDPLQNELERIRREIDEIISIHEETKLRLKSECDKEIEEIVTQIRNKYEGKQKEAEASFSIKRNELQMNQDKVMMHKFLAEAFKSKCTDTKAASGMRQASGSMEQFSQLPATITRPSSMTGSFSGSPSLVIPQNAASHVRPIHPSPVLVPNPPTRAPHINPHAPTAGLQSATHARGPHLQSFRPAPIPVSSSSIPSSAPLQPSPPPQLVLPQASSSAPLQPPPPPPLVPPHASSSAPLQPPPPPPWVPPQAFHRDGSQQGEIIGSTLALNLSLSAMELLMEMGRLNENRANNNLPPLQDNLRILESGGISEFGAAANVQLPSSTSGASDDVICLSDDD